jgi:threonine/homoserine/homoserine lactone efflux protein
MSKIGEKFFGIISIIAGIVSIYVLIKTISVNNIIAGISVICAILLFWLAYKFFSNEHEDNQVYEEQEAMTDANTL